MVGVEGLDFNRNEQIAFTYEKYIVHLINDVKGSQKDEREARSILKNYKRIVGVQVEDLKGESLYGYIQKIIDEEKE